MKTGLVMEGGAMRGMFTCGVIDTFMHNGVDFDGAAGVSAGAVFGCNLKSRQPGRALRYNKRYCTDKRYCSVRSLVRTGDLYNADFCYHEIPDILDPFDIQAFRDNPMDFWCTCTDVVSGKAVYHKLTEGNGEDYLWFRASASIPLASRVVEVGGHKLLDGGMADSIPLAYMESLGYDRIVVVLTQPEGYVKKKNALLPLIRAAMKEYPGLVDAIATRHTMYNKETKYVAQKEKEGSVLVIRPSSPLGIGAMTRKATELQRVYDEGVRQAEAALPALRAFFRR